MGRTAWSLDGIQKLKWLDVIKFVQPTKPTSEMSVGDFWIKTKDGSIWQWNGTYWLGSLQGLSNTFGSLTATNTSTLLLGETLLKNYGLFFESWDITFSLSSTALNSKNDWIIEFGYTEVILGGGVSTTVVIPAFSLAALVPSPTTNYQRISVNYNTVIFPVGKTLRALNTVFTKLNSAPNMPVYTRSTLNLRIIHP